MENSTKTIVRFTGKSANARFTALLSVARQSMGEQLSRNELIASVKIVLGKRPASTHIDAVRQQFIIGRVAAKVAAKTIDDQLTLASAIVLRYATAPKDGVASRKLRKGQTGRRTPAQQRDYQAAKQQFSQLMADCGYGSAKTQAQANASKKRGATGKRTDSKGSAKPDAVPQAATRDIATQHIATQAAALLAYCNKNAKVVPLAFSEPVSAFKTAINAAMNAEQERADK